MHNSPFLPSGELSVGANYWASHAGIKMWRDWRPEVVAEDFHELSKHGIRVLRVFPLWPDFQPINCLRGAHGEAVEIRFGETSIEIARENSDGVSQIMKSRLGVLLDLAKEHGIELIVALVTGWMSGRLFVPPALEGLNPITNAQSRMWQLRLVKSIVTAFKSHESVKAWDLGNECNVMGQASREEAWVWSNSMANAIRAADPSRPVISGMHSLEVDPNRPWSIRDQAEANDLLTTHPYSLFTPHCHREPQHTIRPTLHSVAETCLYSDLGNRPAFVEEFSILGPMMCGTDEVVKFVRCALVSLWAHDCRAALWWCTFDQRMLDYAPYDWIAIERELGLMRADRAPKPQLAEIQSFSRFLAAFPVKKLPRRKVDAICLLTPGQDSWGAAYSAFILAKQAGFEIEFRFADQDLPAADLYLVPSLAGLRSLSRQREVELLERVKAGADLFLSLGDGVIERFEEFTGVRVKSRSQRKRPYRLLLNGHDAFQIEAPLQYEFELRGAAVIGIEESGEPALLRNKIGRGQVFLMSAPLETALAGMAQVFSGGESPPFWKIYALVGDRVLQRRLVRKCSPWLGTTEHWLDDGAAIVVIVNYSPDRVTDTVRFAESFSCTDFYRGGPIKVTPQGAEIELAGNDFAVVQMTRASGRT